MLRRGERREREKLGEEADEHTHRDIDISKNRKHEIFPNPRRCTTKSVACFKYIAGEIHK